MLVGPWTSAGLYLPVSLYVIEGGGVREASLEVLYPFPQKEVQPCLSGVEYADDR